MSRFGSLDYGHPAFPPPLDRSYLDPPNIYPLHGRKQPLYYDDDDDDVDNVGPWRYDGYRVRVDSGLGGPVDPPPHRVPEDHRRRHGHNHNFSRRDRGYSVSPEPSRKESRRKRGGNKFDWLFGRRRRGRPDSRAEPDAGQDGQQEDDVEVESLGKCQP